MTYQKMLNDVPNYPSTRYVYENNFWMNKKYKRGPKIYEKYDIFMYL